MDSHSHAWGPDQVAFGSSSVREEEHHQRRLEEGEEGDYLFGLGGPEVEVAIFEEKSQET